MSKEFNNSIEGEEKEENSPLVDPGFIEEKIHCLGFTKRQWLILSIFGISNIFSTAIISLQAPFYPKEAENKGAREAEYGFVFGIFQLTMFCCSPIFGHFLGRINPKIIFNLGILLAGSCTIFFGFLHYIDDHTTFISLSFVMRILQGIGTSAFISASFTSIAMEFTTDIATAFACFETCAGFGLFVGPLLGGVMFDVGGFPMPFAVMGAGMFILAASVYFILPEIQESTVELSMEQTSVIKGIVPAFGFFSLLKIPSVTLAACSVAACSSTIGFLGGTLEPHLREHFGLSPTSTGSMFIIDAGVYAIFAPMWGKLCDKCSQPKIFTLIGSALTFCGFLLVGPAPFLPFDTVLWVTALGLGIHGLGVGSTLVSAFIISMQDAVSQGLPDNISTYGLVSGLWVSFFALGSFLGPSIGGILCEHFKFRQASYYVLTSQILIALCAIVFMCKTIKRQDKNPETQPLLFDEHSTRSSNNQHPANVKNVHYGAA